MNSLTRLYSTSIAKKWIVALTAIVLIGYVFGHLAGNLQIFMGQKKINDYAEFLHSMGPLLWAVRIFLIFAFVLHIVTSIKLARENRAARPELYAQRKNTRSTFASRTMVMSGLIVLCFVIYHLLHFTLRVVPSEDATFEDPLGRHDTYRMIVMGFQEPLIVLFYGLGVGLLCVHLSHGLSSFLQTLGLTSRGTLVPLQMAARLLSIAIFVGYMCIPVAVLLHVLKYPV